MTIDDTAAAYGLFQVVFADMADHLAVATFRLREHREPGLRFETVFGQQFERTLKQFRQELRQFDDRTYISDRLHDLREACNTMSALAVWRNDRIHARAQMTDQGYVLYVLYNWRTRRRLEITREQIELNLNQAIKAIVDLEAHVHHFVHLLKWDEEFEKLFSGLPDPSESPNDGEDRGSTAQY